MLINSFPKRDETLRFDVINLSILNLLKIRLPSQHFHPFSTATLDDIQQNSECSFFSSSSASNLSLFLSATIHYQCEREPVSDEQLTHFRESVLQRAENFLEKKDRWLAIHQLLHHAYQTYIPLPYIYAIYDAMHRQNYDYRPHYMRPMLVKFRRIFVDNPEAMTDETRKFLAYLQKNFSINYDQETFDLLVEFFLDYCHLKPLDIDLIFKKVNIPLTAYWSNLYLCTLKQINLELLGSLTAFLNANKTVRFELTSTIREQTNQAIQSLINQSKNSETIIEYFNDLVNFLAIINKRFGKNVSDVQAFNDAVLINIITSFYETNQSESIDLLKKIFQLFEQRTQAIPLTRSTREKVCKQLGKKSNFTLFKY